ncbi:MAG TPA: DNA primase [Candidatus Saccharibacteria bacterium]|nr:DNA primase [Candidatus Saccharibacteria bacterium]
MDLKDDIKSRLNIEEVIGRYVQLKRAGRNFKGLSPFTSERTPSFVVSPEKQIWHDFSSNKGGDMFSFIMEVEGLDFKESLELLARQAGLNIDDYKQLKNSVNTDYKTKDRLIAANKSAQIFFQKNLSRYPESVAYIKKRSISRESIIDYGIGWASGGVTGDQLYKHLESRGFSLDEMIKAGLVAYRYGKASDIFRNRLVISLTDIEGRTIGFTGRTLAVDNPRIPKYLNTPQTSIYDKSRQVFGLSLAKRYIKEQDAAILVEGNLDVVSLFQNGFKNVVATAGTAMTINHLKQIKRFSHNIYLAYDSDSAGVSASERAILLSQEVEMTMYIIDLGKFKDPDEMVNQDPKLFTQALKNKTYGLDWLMNKYSEGLDLTAAVDKSNFINLFGNALTKLKDPILIDHYLIKVAEMSNLSIDALKDKLEQLTGLNKTINKPIKLAKIKSNTNTRLDEINSTIDELLTLNLKFSLNLSLKYLVEDLNKEEVGSARLGLILGPDINHNIDTLLKADDSYAKILSLRSEEQFVNWDKDQIDDHHKYLQRKLKILILKNKIDLISSQVAANNYKDKAQLQKLLKSQLSLTNKLRGEEDV